MWGMLELQFLKCIYGTFQISHFKKNFNVQYVDLIHSRYLFTLEQQLFYQCILRQKIHPDLQTFANEHLDLQALFRVHPDLQKLIKIHVSY
jgi:hypothetical protein